MARRRVAFEEMNSRHQLTGACFFSQKAFRRRFAVTFPTGLCAGLVQVWWAELRNGNDGIASIQDATPSLIRDVLLFQARSIYLVEFPTVDSALTAAETELLRFKYGSADLSEVQSLQSLFGVGTALELDLVLQHGSPIVLRKEFLRFESGVLDALAKPAQSGLRLLLMRHTNTRGDSGERGHRLALAIAAEGSCRFYDPSLGEMRFSAVDHFADWFPDYWETAGWDHLLQGSIPSSPPIRIFRFSGALPAEANEKSAALWEGTVEYSRGVMDRQSALNGDSSNCVAAIISRCDRY